MHAFACIARVPHTRALTRARPCAACVRAASYNALLEVCYRTNDSDRALDVIDRMAADEVEPNEITWELAGRKRSWRSYMRKQFG